MGTAFHVASFNPDGATPRYEDHSAGYTYFSVVDHTVGSVNIGKGVSILAPGGHVDRHLHSFEEAFYILEGTVIIGMGDRKHKLVAGDYGFFPVEMTHAWKNISDEPVRWLEICAGQPLPDDDPRRDTWFTRRQFEDLDRARPVDWRDSRNQYLGHWEGVDKLAENIAHGAEVGLDIGLVHPAPGIHIKKLVDKTLGAYLVQLIMCEFAPGIGLAGVTHDHTYEESFFLLDGETGGTINDQKFSLHPGDAFWVGVGTPHGWQNVGPVPIRWLESQCPPPPDRYSYRHTDRWEYLGAKIDAGHEPDE